MNKLKLFVGVLAFVGLAALNFTQSETSFVSMALASSSSASSGSGSSGGFWSSVQSWWDSKTHKCEEDDCEDVINLGVYQQHQHGKREKCLNGNQVAHCWDCKECDA